MYQAGKVINFGTAGVGGLDVILLDGNGKRLTYQTEFTFCVTFACADNFSGTVTSTDALAALPSTGHLNGDAHSDIFWRNDSGALARWTMGSGRGNQIPSGNGIASTPGPDLAYGSQG
ncbi:hypothetical protein [Bradyrhizobium sp. RT3a]|uniref:hypothetical protein n=1 Tax=unclassified Bradyrhizobium TaxID=2631580 RepID=UPI003392E956